MKKVLIATVFAMLVSSAAMARDVVCADGTVIGADPDPFIQISLSQECNDPGSLGNDGG